MYRSSKPSKEYAWETVDVMTIGQTAYAYQQKYEVRQEMEKKSDRPSYSDGLGLGVGVGLTMVPTDEHRLKKMKDTLNEESIKEATQAWENE
ncbi:hypothetical protein M199_gp170 [Halogranum tailed virus 1]|uniref:Uncharacterized protein n=1 Tax=Halogranum tailed virus 1 TaxID=1273749 RepID=R4TGV1_9CAUD|nr:hypothetical protein M199_gp170 [Halogranum tailed virus 1]AGM11496.1 hypothetical protein HGTV1_199 [Halogranum tailed virus 1]